MRRSSFQTRFPKLPRRPLFIALVSAFSVFAALSSDPARADSCGGAYHTSASLQTINMWNPTLAPDGSGGGSPNSSCNQVTMDASVNGGADVYTVMGAVGGSNPLTDNQVIMNGGTVHSVYGAFSTGNNSLTGNSVIINGGTVSSTTYGGGTYWGANGSVTNNSVTIHGGSMEGIRGGVVGGDGSATGNSVTLDGTPTFTGTVYGGLVVGTGDAFTGNKLFKNSNVTLAGGDGSSSFSVGNFEFINFGYAGNANIATLDTTPTGATGAPLVKMNTQGNNVTFGGVMSGTGGINKQGAGTLTLTSSSSSFGGATQVSGGTLRLQGGALGNATSTADTVTVNSGATLSGYGTIHGATTINGKLIVDGGNLGIDANGAANGLTLASGSTIDFVAHYGQLDVTQKIVDQGASWSAHIDSPGVYVLANYDSGSTLPSGVTSGSLAVYLNNTLSSGSTVSADTTGGTTSLTLSALSISTPGSTGSTGIAGQYWNGGNGSWGGSTWSSTTALGETDSWRQNYAVFGAGSTTGGTVTLSGTSPNLYGMSFLKNNWVISDSGGGALNLATVGGHQPSINVEKGVTAIIDADVNSTDAWSKHGTGTLILLHDNPGFTGDLTLACGTVQLGNGGTTGSLGCSGGSCAPGVIGNVPIKLVYPDANLTVNRSDSVTYAGTLTGAGGVTQAGTSNTLTLSGNNSYTGDTTISNSGATLAITGALGYKAGNNYVGNIANSGTLVFNQSADQTLSGEISGGGVLTLNGSGRTLTLAGADTYTGNTNIGAGSTLTVTGTLGTGAGAGGINDYAPSAIITNNGTLFFNQNNDQTISALITGSGCLKKGGTGILTLTNAGNNYACGTTINGGLINFSDPNNFGTGNITLDGGGLQWAPGKNTDISGKLNPWGANGAVFDTNGNDVAMGGNLSGTGGLTKDGAGTLTLNGTNSYGGETVVKGGTLEIGAAGSISSDRLALYDGTTFKDSSTGGVPPLSQLDVYGSPTYDGDLAMKGAGGVINFYVPSSMGNDDTMLRVTGDANIQNSQVNMGFTGGNPLLQVGQHLNLIDAGGTLNSSGINNSASALGSQGVSVIYNFDLAQDANKLVATLRSVGVNPRVKAVSEGFFSGLAHIRQGQDAMLQAVTPFALGLHRTGGRGRAASEFTGIASLHAGSQTYDSGSSIRVNSQYLYVGTLWQPAAVERLSVAGLLEIGQGDYRSSNHFAGQGSVKGHGDLDSIGAAVVGRWDFNNAFWLESSFRGGRIHQDFKTHDLVSMSGQTGDYRLSTTYWGAHLGIGSRWQVTSGQELEIKAQFLWSQEKGKDVRLNSGDPISFKTTDSERSVLGGRYYLTVAESTKLYAGAAWEHEFSAKAKATAYNLYAIDAPKLKGNTGLAELGVSHESGRLKLEAGVQAAGGKRDGVGGFVQAKWKF